MISFRFHVVSITAVFLAIAIGVLVGTTYVDRAVVDSLENRVDRVSRNLDTLRSENSSLQRQVDDLRGYAGASADFAVTDRLVEAPVLLLAVRGVDEDVARQVLALARRAGGVVPGVAWLEGRWGLEGAGDRAALAGVSGMDAGASVANLRNGAVAALVAALSTPEEGDDPAGAAEAGRAVLSELVDAGFVSVDAQGDGAPALTDLVGTAPRVLLLSTSAIEDRFAPLVPLLVTRTSAAGLPTVAGEAYAAREDGPDRGATLLRPLADEVRDRIGVVDDLELWEGRVAAILALAEVAAGRPGHFGYGSGADGVVPAWTAP